MTPASVAEGGAGHVLGASKRAAQRHCLRVVLVCVGIDGGAQLLLRYRVHPAPNAAAHQDRQGASEPSSREIPQCILYRPDGVEVVAVGRKRLHMKRRGSVQRRRDLPHLSVELRTSTRLAGSRRSRLVMQEDPCSGGSFPGLEFDPRSPGARDAKAEHHARGMVAMKSSYRVPMPSFR